MSLVHGFHAHGEGGRVFVSCPLTSTGAPWHRHLPPLTNKCDFKSFKKKILKMYTKKMSEERGQFPGNKRKPGSKRGHKTTENQNKWQKPFLVGNPLGTELKRTGVQM